MNSYERLKAHLESVAFAETEPEIRSLLLEVAADMHGQTLTIAVLTRLYAHQLQYLENIEEWDTRTTIESYTAGYKNGWNGLREKVQRDLLPKHVRAPQL